MSNKYSNVCIPYSLQLTFWTIQVGLWMKVKFPLLILLKIVDLFVEMLSVIFCIFCLPARIEIMLYIFYRTKKLTYTKCLRKLFLWLCFQIQYNCYYGILWTFNFLSDCITSKIVIVNKDRKPWHIGCVGVTRWYFWQVTSTLYFLLYSYNNYFILFYLS